MATADGSEGVPPFSLRGCRYDQGAYWGRVQQFASVVNPRLMFVTQHKLEHSLSLLSGFKEHGARPDVSDEELWEAKLVKEAIIHPDTGKQIVLPFRMSAFVANNIPIVIGMMNARSPAAQMFWQWYNQSYNVAVNHANRNASNEMTTAQITTAYTGACASSMTIAWLLGRAVKGSQSFLARAFIPYLAVAGAGAINVLLMRRNEAVEGITVTTSDGTPVGVSRIAGQKAIIECAVSRAVLGLPVIVIPTAIMTLVDKARVIRSPRVRTIVEILTVSGSLLGALPCAIGLFPQERAVDAHELEEEFHSLPHSRLYFNKGL